MAEYIATDTELTAVANAIRTKGGTSDALSFPSEFVSAIEAIPQGGGGGDSSGVNFYDYDGSLVKHYTAEQFVSLAEMPANPSHGGLTAQGWNWSLADAKAYVADYEMLNIGQMYITSSGDTELDVEFHDGRLKPYLSIAINGTVEIDWGDGSAKDTATGTSLTKNVYTPHEYAQAGSYTISIHVVSGGFTFYGSNGVLQKAADTSFDAYNNAIQCVRIGNGVTSIGGAAFYQCYSLASVSIPDGVTSIGDSAFGNCWSLASVSIPSGATSIGGSVFQNCWSLASVNIPSGVTSIGGSFQGCNSLASITIPNSVTSMGTFAFSECRSLTAITIPSGVTSIEYYAFAQCHSLTSIIIPDGVTSIGGAAFYQCYSLASVSIPDGVTTIGGNAFQSCYSLASVSIPDGVTSIGSSAFYQCYSLASVSIPDGVTSIGSSAFYQCYSLASVSIPDGVTSIGGSAFNGCYSLASVSIPDSVTSIGSSAFQNCRGLGEIHFLPTTPPTVASSNAFSNIPTDCIIYVPAGHLADYTGATNYPSSSTYTYVEE